MRYLALVILALSLIRGGASANPTPSYRAHASLDGEQTVPPTDSPGDAEVDLMGWGSYMTDITIYCYDIEDSATALTICHGSIGTNGEILFTPFSGGISCGTGSWTEFAALD